MKKKKKKEKIFILLMIGITFVIIGILAFPLKKTNHNKLDKNDSLDDNAYSLDALIKFSSTEEDANNYTYDTIVNFINEYQSSITFKEKNFEEYYDKDMDVLKNCSGKILKQNNSYIFKPTCNIIKGIQSQYILNTLPDEIRQIENDFVKELEDGFFLYGVDNIETNVDENVSYNIFLMKYDSNNTLEWYQKIDTQLDNEENLSYFDVYIEGIVKEENDYKVFYTRSYSISNDDDDEVEGEDTLYLAILDLDGNLKSNLKVMDIDSGLMSFSDIKDNKLRYYSWNNNAYKYITTSLEEGTYFETNSSYDYFYNVDDNYFYGVVEEEYRSEYLNEDDTFKPRNIDKLDENGNLIWSIDLQKLDKNIKNYTVSGFHTVGNYLILSLTNMEDEKEENDSYIFDKNGNFIKKMNLNYSDEVYYNAKDDYYYIICEDSIEIYDNSFNKIKEYNYYADEKLALSFSNGKIYSSGILRSKDKKNRFQLLFINSFE